MFQTIFKRYEKKYLIDSGQYNAALDFISYNAVPDEFGKSTVCSIYYDTPDKRLIRASIEKPVYKEKLRLRSYGVPNNSSRCFLELKKKYKGVVYKRRIEADYVSAVSYMKGNSNALKDTQIRNEIDYFKSYYGALNPSVDIFYSRNAFYDRNDRNVRITFDSDIFARDYDFDLKNGIYGDRILENGLYLMEIKTAGAMPYWVCVMLNELKIYPATFSKYGTAYKNSLTDKKSILTGGDYCA